MMSQWSRDRIGRAPREAVRVGQLARLVPLAVLAGVPLLLSSGGLAGAQASGTTIQDKSPVDLATPSISKPGRPPLAIVQAGDIRVEILGSTLLRLEYSPSHRFENAPTVNVLNRQMPVPRYSSSTAGGWLTVRTSHATFRYKLDSGPFTPLNTTLTLSVGGRTSTVAPTWEWECTFAQVCQAGAAKLAGGSTLGQTFSGYRALPVMPGTSSTRVRASHGVSSDPSPVLRSCHCDITTGQPAVDTADQHARPRRQRPAPAGSRCEPDDSGRALGNPDHHRAAGIRNELDRRGQCHSRQFRPRRRHVGGRSCAVGPAQPARQPGPSGAGSGVSTPTPTTTPPPAVPGSRAPHARPSRAAAHRRAPRHRRMAAARRHAERGVDGEWMGRPRPTNGDVEDGYLFVYGHDYAGALRTWPG